MIRFDLSFTAHLEIPLLLFLIKYICGLSENKHNLTIHEEYLKTASIESKKTNSDIKRNQFTKKTKWAPFRLDLVLRMILSDITKKHQTS